MDGGNAREGPPSSRRPATSEAQALAEAPPIDRFVVGPLEDYFWWEVLGSPNHGPCLVSVTHVLLGQPKVSKFDMAFPIDEYVFGFEIPVEG